MARLDRVAHIKISDLFPISFHITSPIPSCISYKVVSRPLSTLHAHVTEARFRASSGGRRSMSRSRMASLCTALLIATAEALLQPGIASLSKIPLSRPSIPAHCSTNSCCMATFPEASTAPELPKWVNTINAALEKGAAAYVLTYIVLDLGTALVLCVAFMALRIRVAADFALAFALAKSPPLRGPRLGLDSAVAAALTRAYPPLAAVRVSLLADAVSRFAGIDEIAKRLNTVGRDERATPSKRQRRLARAADATRRITDEYGLAYLVVKNILGPLTVLGLYAAIRVMSGGGAGSASVHRASEFVARLAIGPGGSSFDGVRLPSVGQTAGCVALASTVSAMLFPLLVFGAAKLAPFVAGWVAARLRANEAEDASQSAAGAHVEPPDPAGTELDS